jgi:predicted AAA+ superfamily ATPase
MPTDAGDVLVRALHDHNPWWAGGVDAISLPVRPKSDFYRLVRPDEADSQFEDQPILGLVGRRGVGKTTLLHQFVAHRVERGDDPARFCYLPFDGDPLYQLRSDEQLRRAVRYYESRVLSRADDEGPHFLLVDDVHRVEHPQKPTVDGWGVPVSDLVARHPGRHVVVTATASVQVDRELDAAGVPDDAYDTQPILPETFRDYVFSLYPDLEREATRVGPSSLRSGDTSLPAALRTGDLDPLVAELRAKHDRVAEAERRVRPQVIEYLAMGGTISFAREGVVESAATLDPADYARLRAHVRDALYQQVPDFESIRTIADLERLCALAAHSRGTDPYRYQDLVDLFDVDRRTIADSYLPALAALSLLAGVTEYDNSRPRAVRLYLRDTGVVVAFADGDAAPVRADFDREADLARVAAFDHTTRFADGVEAAQGRDAAPDVRYWRGDAGEVDYVFEVDGTPVPVGLAYRPADRDDSLAAVREFRAAYDAPLGLLLTGDTVDGAASVARLGDGVVQVPYWLYLLLC